MCQQFITLARSTEYRHIMQCEHGTIHLTWDLVTFYLSPAELEHMAQLLERLMASTTPAVIREQTCQVLYHEKNYYQVWLRSVALNLSPANFLVLVDLIRAALQELQATAQAGLASWFDLLNGEAGSTARAVINFSFSDN